MNKNGLAIAVWETHENGTSLGNIYVSERNSKGIWSTPIQINSQILNQESNGIAKAPTIALNDNGEAVVTWYTDVANTRGNIYVSERSSSGEWSAEQQINSSSGGSNNIAVAPQVTMNDSGEAVVTWYTDVVYSTGNIYVSTRSASGTWSAEQQVSNTSGGSNNISLYPQVAMNDSGEVVVSWFTAEPNNYNIYVSTRSANGTWSAEQQINSSSGGSNNIAVSPQVTVNNAGEVVLAWNTLGNDNIYVSTKRASGTWSSEQQINATAGGSSNVSFSPQVAMNVNGEAVATWYTILNNAAGNIYVSSLYNLAQAGVSNARAHSNVSTQATTPVAN